MPSIVDEVAFEKTRVSIKKTSNETRIDFLEPRAFLNRWLEALRLPGHHWEGPIAIKELERRGLLRCVRCQDGRYLFPDLLDRALAELVHYRNELIGGKENIEEVRSEFREAEAVLRSLEIKSKRKSQEFRLIELKDHMLSVSTQLNDNRLRLQTMKTRILKSEHSRLGVWELLWKDHASHKFVGNGVGLDKRLQIQLAKNFMRTLRVQDEITLATIARLVALTYWVGGLAKIDPSAGSLRLQNGKPLTPRKILDALHDAGLHRVRFAEPKIRKTDLTSLG